MSVVDVIGKEEIDKAREIAKSVGMYVFAYLLYSVKSVSRFAVSAKNHFSVIFKSIISL